MATKKIRNLDNTATIPASDDYDVIDGEVNGTRKILSSAREYVANKEQTALDTSFTKYPCNNVVKSALDAKANATDLSTHVNNLSNPHTVTATQVGLGNCDNTSDLNKPISTATQSAIDLKANDSEVVHNTGTETISGTKTFSNPQIISPSALSNALSIKDSTGSTSFQIKNWAPSTCNVQAGNNVGNLTMTGIQNVGYGYNCMSNTTNGNYNVAFGAEALKLNQSGPSNSALGVCALRDNTIGGNNVGVGLQALIFANANYNTAIGAQSLRNITSGGYNVGIGALAGFYISGGSTANQTSTNSIYIGYNTKANANADTNEIVIGHGATGAGSNTVTLGNASITDIYANQSGTATVHASKITCSPTISSGTVAPTSTPSKVGDIYIDTTNTHTYVANGISSSSDWVKQNGSYTLLGGAAGFSPAGSTTYYFGSPLNLPPTISGGQYRRIIVPKSGVITRVVGEFYQSAGSGETSSLYIRVNNTTDYLVSNSILNNVTDMFVNVSSLNISVSAGDYFVFKWVTPTWATSPKGLITQLTALIDL